MRLLTIVRGFRRGILAGRKSRDMCFAVCAPLQAYLSCCIGIETELIEGDFERCNHIWLQLPDGRIIDPTADQFKTPEGKRMPKVYIGPLPEWYASREYWKRNGMAM